MKELDKIFNALADKNRLRILKLLENKKMCVCELAFVMDITQPCVSKHLKKLKTAGLIESRQDGFWTDYFINERGTLYANKLLKNLKGWLKKDRIVRTDLEKAKKANRQQLCCKNK